MRQRTLPRVRWRETVDAYPLVDAYAAVVEQQLFPLSNRLCRSHDERMLCGIELGSDADLPEVHHVYDWREKRVILAVHVQHPVTGRDDRPPAQEGLL